MIDSTIILLDKITTVTQKKKKREKKYQKQVKLLIFPPIFSFLLANFISQAKLGWCKLIISDHKMVLTLLHRQ